MTDDEKRHLAETVRAAGLDAAVKSYEQASISGLCGEGAWEAARGAIRIARPETPAGTRREG